LESGTEGNIWMSEGENDRGTKTTQRGDSQYVLLIKYYYNAQTTRMELAKIVEISTHIFMVLRHVGA